MNIYHFIDVQYSPKYIRYFSVPSHVGKFFMSEKQEGRISFFPIIPANLREIFEKSSPYFRVTRYAYIALQQIHTEAYCSCNCHVRCSVCGVIWPGLVSSRPCLTPCPIDRVWEHDIARMSYDPYSRICIPIHYAPWWKSKLERDVAQRAIAPPRAARNATGR